MNTLNTFCWRQAKLSKLALLILVVAFFSPSAVGQVSGSLSQNSAIDTSTFVNIDIRPSTENEFYVADYQQGEAPQLGVAVSRDSYVYIFSIDSDLRYAQVFPNSFEANNYVYAAQGANYPSFQGNYSFSLEGLQGFTTLFAIASPRAVSEARLERYVQKYLLFAEAYSDPAKLANVVIGPGIGSDISYLRTFGTQDTQSASNVVPINPVYYQLDYALDAVTTPDAALNATTLNTIDPNVYNLANYGEEYSSGAYATAEYQEVLRSYQAGLDIYNTYSNETATASVVDTSLALQNDVSLGNAAVETNYDKQPQTYRQTITLNGVEAATAPTATTDYGQQSSIQHTEVVQSVTTAEAIEPTSAASVDLSSPIDASTVVPTTLPIAVVEQSLQSAVTTSPFKSWTALNLSNYRFVFQQFCYCSEDYLYPMIVSVENGGVSRVQYLENNQDVPDYVFNSVPSIEDIFMGIAEIRVEGVTTVNVAYDQDFSFPNNTYFVNNPETDVDDVSYQISYFEAQ